MAEFAKESLEVALEEAKPLFLLHWQETEMYRAGTAFNPKYQRYVDYNKIGFYQFFTVRVEGKLVGNAGIYVTEGMHDQRQMAQEDTWFLLTEARGGMSAVRFLAFVEADLRAQGVTDFYMSTKLANQAGRILELRGFAHVANQYWKNLECVHLTRPRRRTTPL